MKRNYRFIDIGLLIGVLLFLFLPLFQNTLHIKKWVKPLKGAYTAQKDSSFKWKSWFEESYQQQKNNFLNQNFGLRNYYVMLNNQIDFTFFHKINAEHVVVGKAGVFFEDNYIDAYYGKNFIGKSNLEQLAAKLKDAQEILKSNGIQLEILFLPGKASYFPEYIPERFKLQKTTSNYEYLSGCAEKINLDIIDFNKWFKKLKPKSVYDLYPSGGIHWSNYGSLLAFDSLRKHIDSRTSVKLREFEITRVQISQDLQSPDNDIAEALNLWTDIKSLGMPYAEYKWLDKPGEIKPTALFIGDSYFWNWYYQGLVNNFFSDARFWYYNQTVYPDTLAVRDVKNLPFKETVSANRVIILMATESNIHDIGWGFADMVINSFKKNEINNKAPLTKDEVWRKDVYLRYFANEIHNTPNWMEKIKVKAKEKNISPEAMLLLDAEYLYNTEYNLPDAIDFTEQTKERIRKDEKWLKDVTAKAREKKISVEEMLELDAKYIYDAEIKAKKK